MKRFLIIANCVAIALTAAVCTPLVMHGKPITPCTALHVGCMQETHVSVRFQKIAFSATK